MKILEYILLKRINMLHAFHLSLVYVSFFFFLHSNLGIFISFLLPCRGFLWTSKSPCVCMCVCLLFFFLLLLFINLLRLFSFFYIFKYGCLKLHYGDECGCLCVFLSFWSMNDLEQGGKRRTHKRMLNMCT